MRYDMHVHLPPERVLDEAARFFGPEGRKMTQSARQGSELRRLPTERSCWPSYCFVSTATAPWFTAPIWVAVPPDGSTPTC